MQKTIARNISLISGFYYLNPAKVFILVFIPFTAGFFIKEQYLLPVLTALPAGLVLIKHLKHGNFLYAIIDMIAYVFWLSIIGLLLMSLFPSFSDKVILHGQNYWNEMIPWLRGMPSKEGDPSLFISEHIKHMIVVAVASLLSAGLVAILFGTVLMNYMNYYVSQLILNSSNPFLMALIGWHPWSVLRVISFIILGVALATPMANGFSGIKIARWKILLAIIVAILLEVGDILLKTYIGPSWRDLLVSHLNSRF